MSKVVVFDHPLIQHKLSIMRSKETGSKDFRQLLTEISMLMGSEITRDFPVEPVRIETPICQMTARRISGKKLAIVPILRAGLGMVDGLLSLLPPDIQQRTVIVTDPMLATGGSSCDAITMLKERGCDNIRLMCLVAAPEGIRKVQQCHPDVDIFVAAVDDHLNEDAYIVPGLGDAGDRIFGTK